MKKVTLVLGYLAVISTVLFAIFKFSHLPGARWAIIAGCILFSLGYAPLLMITRNKLADSGLKKFTNIIACLAMLFVGATVLTKTQHWVNNNIIDWMAAIFLILAVLMTIIQSFMQKDPGKSLCGHNKAIILAMATILIMYLGMTRTPNVILNDFNMMIESQNKEIKYYNGKTTAMLENFDKSPSNPAAQAYLQKATEVKARTDSMVVYIRSIGESLIFAAEETKMPFDSMQFVCHKADRTVVKEVFAKEKTDSIYKIKLAAYTSFMTENTNSRGKEILDIFFKPCDTSCCSGKEMKKGCCDGCSPSLIGMLTILNSDIVHLRLLETETVTYLQAMQAKAVLRIATEEQKKGK
ncbi:MAG: hypothetical protein NTU44_14280 [Bacteroidetes bacterium]|nr:hypothetical protein [Bacteroidota bacterium]